MRRIGELQISAHAIEELQDERPVVSFSREEVATVRPSVGFVAERWWAELLLGGC